MTDEKAEMAALVEKMLDAKKKLATTRTDSDSHKQFYERFCTSLDTQIDELRRNLIDTLSENAASAKT